MNLLQLSHFLLKTHKDIEEYRPDTARYPWQCSNDIDIFHTEQQYTQEVREIAQGNEYEHQQRYTTRRFPYKLLDRESKIINFSTVAITLAI